MLGEGQLGPPAAREPPGAHRSAVEQEDLVWGRGRGRLCCRHRVRVRVMGAAGTGPAFIRVRGDAGNTLVREALAKQQMAATYIDSRPALRRPLLSAPEHAAGCPELQPALANQRWPQRPCGFDIASHDQRPCELSIHTLEQRRAEELQAQVRCRRVGGDDGVLCERRRRVKSGPATAGGERQRAAHSIELARYSEQQPEHKCEQQQQRHSGERFARTPQNFRLNLPATKASEDIGNVHVVMCGICKQNSLARLFPNHHNKHNT